MAVHARAMRQIALLAALVAAAALPPPAVAAADWSWPVRGDVVTPYRNGDDPYAAGQHRGVDIAAPVGAPVSAAASGRVTFAGAAGSSGLTVSVRSGDGAYDVSYLHLSALAVHESDAVGRGDRIGAVGVSGRRSVDDPHLHFGIREAGSRHAYRDPLDFLPPLARPVGQPEPPAGAPAPAPAPAPLAVPPAPAAPVPAQPLAPEPTAGASAALPAAGPAPLAAGSGGPVRTDPHTDAAAPRDASAGQPRAAASHAPAPHPTPSPTGGGARIHAAPPLAPRPSGSAASSGLARGPLGRGPGLAPDSSAEPVRADRPAHAQPSGAAGIEVGWLAALAGMVAAAACLGRPGGSRRAARSGRAAVAGLLRPLVGRG
jgi:hypothetical protein